MYTSNCINDLSPLPWLINRYPYDLESLAGCGRVLFGVQGVPASNQTTIRPADVYGVTVNVRHTVTDARPTEVVHGLRRYISDDLNGIRSRNVFRIPEILTLFRSVKYGEQ